MISRHRLFVSLAVAIGIGMVAAACGDDTTATPTPDDAGSSGTDSGTDSSAPPDANGSKDANDKDTGGEAGPVVPDSPEKAQTVTAGQAISGSVPPRLNDVESAHYYKYVPATAFSSVTVNVTTLGPADAKGQMRWTTSTPLGLCDLTSGVNCCQAGEAPHDGPTSCHLTIKEGASVVAGKTYLIVALGGYTMTPFTDYAFTIQENP